MDGVAQLGERPPDVPPAPPRDVARERRQVPAPESRFSAIDPALRARGAKESARPHRIARGNAPSRGRAPHRPASREPRLRGHRADHEGRAPRVRGRVAAPAQQHRRRHPDAVLRNLAPSQERGLTVAIRVALSHRTRYVYTRAVSMTPQVIRLRPAPHTRTPIHSYSLRITPAKHFLNWQQDAYGNFLARVVVPEKTNEFSVTVDLVADLEAFNPFDFFVEPYAEKYPFVYPERLRRELAPFLIVEPGAVHLEQFVEKLDRSSRRMIDFLVDTNRKVYEAIDYVIRLEPGVQTAEETLSLGRGSCRDSSWLLVQVLRQMGIAARFVSGYLIQLTADQKPVDGPAGPENDFTDLHAWCEAYLPGAGWIGLDPTSGLLAAEGHIPLACAPEHPSA